jgi:hypothetical protein
MNSAIIPALAGRMRTYPERPSKRRTPARCFLQHTVNSVAFLTTGARGFALHAFLIGVLGFASSADARDSLGVFETWGAFRDPGVPRCYAIARSERRGGPTGFVTVGVWPNAKVRGQVHFRLSRAIGPGTRIELRISGETIALVGGGFDVWAPDPRGDAAVIAAMRSADRMTVRVKVPTRQRGSFADSYLLAGAATAMDAALVGCAGG